MRSRHHFKLGVSSTRDWVHELARALLIRSWWVFVFALICYLLYSEGINKKILIDQELQEKILDFEKKKRLALEMQYDLKEQIQSQNDPAWIELTLMKGLGVVPEGQIKVYFNEQQ